MFARLNSKQNINIAGFIGPIGEDLPSLIPIIFALVVFFAAFSSANQSFYSRAELFSAQIEANKLIRQLRGESYIKSYADFMDRCNSITTKRTRFIAGLMDISSFELKDLQQRDDSIFYENRDGKFICTNAASNPADAFTEINNENLIINFFPIALEERYAKSGLIVKPMLLVVYVWTR